MSNTPPPPQEDTDRKRQSTIRVEDLGELIYRKRRRENLTLQQAAEQIGTSAATLSRLERHRPTARADTSPPIIPETRTLTAITHWLGVSIEELLGNGPAESDEASTISHEVLTPDTIVAHLRANPKLDEKGVEMVTQIFRAAYEQALRMKGLSMPEATAQLGTPSPTSTEQEASNQEESHDDEQPRQEQG